MRVSVLINIFIGITLVLLSGCSNDKKFDNQIPSMNQVETVTIEISPITSDTPIPTNQKKEDLTSTCTVRDTPMESAQSMRIDKTPTISGTIDKEDDHSSIFLIDLDLGYIFLDMINKNIETDVLDYASKPADFDQPSPGKAIYLEFAHFENYMSYWVPTNPAQLWISDLKIKSFLPVYTDLYENYPVEYDLYPYYDLDLFWTPDDKNLIIDFEDSNLQDLIYHLDSGELVNWNYYCDRIAKSPNSNKLALWCASNDDIVNFAVIEFNSVIWYSDSNPQDVLVHRTAYRPPNWGWSSDGERVAYFDPNDAEGHLYISNANGIEKRILPGSAYWLAENLRFEHKKPIQWSEDGNRLLIYARGEEKNICPPWIDYWGDNKIYSDVPCWQVLDVEKGEIIWTLGDVSQQIFGDQALYSSIAYDNASISADGHYLVITASSGGYKELFIVNIDNGEISKGRWPYRSESLRWSK